MESLPQTVVPSSKVIATHLDGETVLLHQETAHIFTLNETGTFIWQAITGGKSLEKVVSELEALYAVTSEQAHQSVDSLVRELMAEGLLLPRPEAKG